MAFIPCEDIVEVAMNGHLAGRVPWTSILHIDNASAETLSQAGADAVAGIIGDAWEDSGLLAFLSTGWTLDEYVCTDLSTPTSPQFTSVAGVQNGSDGAQVLPGQTAGMIEWQTASRGRSFRGRSFFCGFCEDASDGLPLVGVVQALTLFATGLIGDLTTASAPLVVLSRFSGTQLVSLGDGQVVKRPKPRAAGVATPITAGLGETVWKTQRRRAFPG